MKALVQRHSADDFVILGVNTDRDPEKYRQEMMANEIPWDSVWNGSTRGGIPEAWGVSAYPTLYLLDRDGVIRYLSPRGERLEAAVDELVAEGR